MSIITLPENEENPYCTAPALPFKVVSDQKHIILIRQSSRGTLLLNRFLLTKTTSGPQNQGTDYELTPVWEVRFERSGKQSVPADTNDPQSYLDGDGNPFLEPTIELAMVDAVTDGRFEALLLPIQDASSFNWQFLVYNQASGQMALYHFPADETGLPDVSGKQLTDNGDIPPDQRFRIQNDDGKELVLKHAPSAVLYMKHENAVSPDGQGMRVKRSGRVLIAIAAEQDQTPVTALLDVAVATTGRLATLATTITASPLQPANYALAFDELAYVTLNTQASDNPLAIAGPFELDFWFRPEQVGAHSRLIIGGNQDLAPEKAAPYIRLTADSRIEMGFGTGSATVVCHSAPVEWREHAWYHLSLSYSGKGDAPFTLQLNGSSLPLSSCSAPAEPAGNPVTQVSAEHNGLVGQMDAVIIKVAGNTVCHLPFDRIDYSTKPPLTPNEAGSSSIKAEVYSARLTLSTSPSQRNTTGTLNVDADGLSWYAGIAGFIQPKASPLLLEGAESMLRLYFQTQDDTFGVAHYSTLTQRAIYTPRWTTQNSGDENKDSGLINLVGKKAGTLMNDVKVSVADGPTDSNCDATFSDALGQRTETWHGLPRVGDYFTQVINGLACNDPSHPELLSGGKRFFDYSGTYPQVIAPCSDPAKGYYYQFVSRLPQDAPLKRLVIADGSQSNRATLTVAAAPAHWQTDNQLITQQWPDVARNPAPLTETIAGNRNDYPYDSIESPDTSVYALKAQVTGNTATQVILFVHKPKLADFAIDVADGARPDLCQVSICATVLKDVPRDQNRFVRILNGQDHDYSYPDGYKSDIAPYLYATSDGVTATVRNASRATADTASPMAYCRLFRAFFTGSLYDPAPVSNLDANASCVQGAQLQGQGDPEPINGSRLFGATLPAPPVNGAVPLVGNTSVFTHDRAPLAVEGANGGWIQEPPRFALAFNTGDPANYLTFNTEQGFMPLEALSIPGDLTLETWLNPMPDNAEPLMRALTYNVTGNTDYPDMPFRYLAGTKQGPCLAIGTSTFVQRAYNFQPPAATLQLYIRITSDQYEGDIASIFAVQASSTYLNLSLNSLGRPVLQYIDTPVITADQSLPKAEWALLTATVRKTSPDKVTVALYLNDQLLDSAQASDDFSDKLGVLKLGSAESQDLSFTVNGASMWRVGLTSNEVTRTFHYDYADNETGLLIRWNCTEGTGSKLVNAAASGEDYDGEVTNPADPAWNEDGVYQVPFVGRNDLIYEAGGVTRNWTHVAYVYGQGRGLRLQDQAFGEVSNGRDLNVSSRYSLEIAIKPDTLGQTQVLIDKNASYEVTFTSLNQIAFTTRVMIGDKAETVHVVSSPLQGGDTYFITCTFDSGSVPQNPSDPSQPLYPKYYARARVYINGEEDQKTYHGDYTETVVIEESDNAFILGKSHTDDFYYQGTLGAVRVWQRLLSPGEISAVANYHEPPGNREGLLANWDFSEAQGKTAYDQQGENHLQLTDNDLWCLFEAIAHARVYVDGQQRTITRLGTTDVGGYGDRQFSVSALFKENHPSQVFQGALDELRLWRQKLTGEQIRDSMNRALTGAETNLAGYWRFDTGSGLKVYDQTGRGNNASMVPANVDTGPQWLQSTAPISNEAAPVYNVLNGVRTAFTSTLSGTPAVAEYADTQEDAYGAVFSVLKRAYLYNPDDVGASVLLTGYKVGDLDTIYVGQVQTQPKVVGYIEGGPPIPSENQTKAYWAGPPGTANPFNAASSVTLSESKDTTWSFSASQGFSVGATLEAAGGMKFKGKFGVSAGVGAETSAETGEYIIKAGISGGLSMQSGTNDGAGSSHTSHLQKISELAPAGAWEPAEDMLNPTVGRRYVQSNTGTAMVKSTTADLYMVALKGTQTAIKYSLRRNPNIPEDVNILDFPINPRYVKNGTLDGKVGFENDPSYPGADSRRGSYFNPVQAYALKRRIEKQEQQLQSYHDQFNVNSLRSIQSLDRVKDKLADNPAYNWGQGFTKRSLANTYVWSAGGGLYQEEHATLDQYSESRSGTSQLAIKGGLKIEGDTSTPAGGFFGEFDALLNTSFEMAVSRNQNTSVACALSASAEPTGFLNAPVIEIEDGKPVFKGYSDNPAPGKVDTYRYLAFFLAPSQENFKHLQQVIEPNWLHNSDHANAAALRQATEAENGAWRILYRTTFVSRVPMDFQPTKTETLEPEIEPPANLAENNWLVRLVEQQIGEQASSPLEIGRALDATLGSSTDNPGVLGNVLPWWKDFLGQAATFGTAPYKQLLTLREDLLQYMIQTYEAREYDAS
ncbi:LamG-like jellyroll fold domain-containing protein [Halomonadaceae bacterium KBTZ08]